MLNVCNVYMYLETPVTALVYEHDPDRAFVQNMESFVHFEAMMWLQIESALPTKPLLPDHAVFLDVFT